MALRFFPVFLASGASLATTLIAGIAAAQPIQPPPATDQIAPALPEPPVGENESAQAFLRAARVALATGRNGEARQALEMSQTRLLDRSVPLFKTNMASVHPAIPDIRAALDALAAGDRVAAMQQIDLALPLAVAEPEAR